MHGAGDGRQPARGASHGSVAGAGGRAAPAAAQAVGKSPLVPLAGAGASVGAAAAQPERKPADDSKLKKADGPDVGRVVAVSAPGNNPYYVKHQLVAAATLGVADDEPQALAMAKTLGTDVAIVPSTGRYYLYAIGGQASVAAGAPLDLMPGYAERAGLRLQAGVAAVVNRHGATYRAADLAAPTENAHASSGATADPFEAHKQLGQSKGGIDELPEPELLATMRGAMVDTALSMLASSEAQARAKAGQLGAPGATSAGEHQQIEDTARQVLVVQRDIEQRQMFMAMSAQGTPRMVAETRQAEIKQRIADKKRLLASYPMLGRYESVAELEAFLAKPAAAREKLLASDATGVVSDIQTTRRNIQSGDLDLWDVPPVVEATLAGLEIAKDSPPYTRIKAKVSAQHTKQTVLNIALAVFNVGFGVAGALLTGPVGLAFAAGALGVGSYDAFKTTDEHQVKNAAANTSTDPDDGLLPADARQSWGWLVVAWGGVALSFADVLKATRIADEVGKVARGKSVAEAAEALAGGDQKLLSKLRLAAGDAKVTDAVTEALLPGLGGKIGAQITIDARLGTDVRVLYQVDERGRTFVTAVAVGPNAKVGDILVHAVTVQALDRYSGLAGKCRDLWDRIRSFAGMGKAGASPFAVGTKAAESYEELQKLDRLIAYRRALIQELLDKSPSATDIQAAIRAEIAHLEHELAIHTRVVNSLATDPGQGFVAMSNAPGDAPKPNHRLADLPTHAATATASEAGTRVGPGLSRLSKAMANKGSRLVHTPRDQAMHELLEEARRANVAIHSDEEAQRLLDWAARTADAEPHTFHAVTIGDDIFVRPEHLSNVRILREELIHVFQQRAGISSAEIVEKEIEARLMMIRYRHRWGITAGEILEMIHEVRTIRKTGRY